jgi:hypothetical protein
MPTLDAIGRNQPLNLQEALTHYANAVRAISRSPLARATFGSRSIAVLAAALNRIPPLCQEVHRSRIALELARLDYANLLAAARSALTADRDGEPDPLWYIRDELAERGQLPQSGGETRETPW